MSFTSFYYAYTHLKLRWPNAQGSWEAAGTTPFYITHFANEGEWSNGLYQCASGISFLYDALNFMFEFSETYYFNTGLMESLRWAAKEPEAGDITWRAICSAWLKDDFEGRAPTIAIIDRMRQILWDEPFDITWAARPEKKKI